MIHNKSSNTILHSDFDLTTGLRNTLAFRNRMSQSILEHNGFKIMLLGIDNFSHINGLYLYAFGDKVLKFFSEKVTKILPLNVELFRLDGSEFGLFYFGDKEDLLSKLYDEISQLLANITIDTISINLTISAGMCKFNNEDYSADALYQNAKFALIDAKKNKTKRVVYCDSLLKKHKSDMQLLDKLKWSLANNFEGFFLCFQPIVKSKTKELDGCEVLLRWSNPAFGGIVSPIEFIPILQNHGMLTEVGNWVIEQAFEQCAKWHEHNPDFQMNVNVSASQFKEEKFVSFVFEQIKKYKLNPRRITLELTESEQIDFEIVNDAFSLLRKQGIMTAFDDFGTGYSSVDIFRTISADELKIDRSFIQNISYNLTDQVILRGIIDICRNMNIIVCVEGIEDKETESIVVNMNPEVLQGYLYDKPMTKEAFEFKYFSMGKKKDFVEKPITIRPTTPLKPLELINGISCGILQLKMGGKFSIIAYNDFFCRITGFSSNEIAILKNDGMQFMHIEDRERVMFELEKQLRETGISTVTYRLLTVSGEYKWVLAVGSVIEHSDGTPTLVVTIADIDDLKNKNEL